MFVWLFTIGCDSRNVFICQIDTLTCKHLCLSANTEKNKHINILVYMMSEEFLPNEDKETVSSYVYIFVEAPFDKS